MKERIRQIRKYHHLSQTAFGAKIGVGIGVIKNLEQGKTQLTSPLLELLCATYNVNSDWLLTGNGEMFKPVDDYAASLQNRNDLSPKAKFLLTRFLDMSTEEQDELVDLLQKLVEE